MNLLSKTFKGIFIAIGCVAAVAILAIAVLIISSNFLQPPGLVGVEHQAEPQHVASVPDVALDSGTSAIDGDVSDGQSQSDPDNQQADDTGETTEGDDADDYDNGASDYPESAPVDIDPPLSGNAPLVGTLSESEEIQAAVDRISEQYNAVGVQVAVINNGRVAGTYEYGYATRTDRPMTADTKIRAASVSKVVLAMTIMRLSELRQINIDRDIGEYWGAPVRNPNHPDNPVTMRQMLSHTSSIRVYDYGFEADGELIRSRFLDGSGFGRSTPGAIGSWNYNNYAYAALGVTVEVATDRTVNSIAAEHLFEPLGIDAAFGTGSISDTDNLATIYGHGGGVGRSVSAQLSTLGSTFPGECGEEFPGGLTISALDLAKLTAALIGNGEYNGVRVLSRNSVAMMQTSQGRTGGFDQCLPMRRRENLLGEDVLFFHTGSRYGVFSLMSYNPNNRNGVVVLTTGANGIRDVNNLPLVCADISEYIYSILRS